ncbi:hypothetical protein ACHAXR_011116 [Thalassiosira sp. AJA248-18]
MASNRKATIQHPLGTDPLAVGGMRSVRSTSSLGITPTPRRRGSRRGSNAEDNPLTISKPNPHQQQPTAATQPTSTQDTARQQIKQLPRTLRWRLSLGLLTLPTTDSNEKEKLLKSIESLNALKLRFQRSRYDELEKKHYWKSTPTAIADETANDGGGNNTNAVDNNNSGGAHNLEGLHHVAPGDDPLSAALLQDKNPKNGTKKNKGEDRKNNLFGGKGKNGIFGRRDRGKHPLSDSLHSVGSSSDGDEQACGGSRWADFYSTREVLDVIEKDLVRLPSDHYRIYHEWRIKNKEWKDHREKEEQWKRQQDEREAGRDSPMLEESDQDEMSGKSENAVKHPKHQSWTLGQSWKLGSLRKGVQSSENLTDLLQIEEEDKKELTRQENAEAEKQTSIKERAGRISQILFVYASSNPAIGYRQGMHEVLSNILLALEMDLLEQAIVTERKRWRRNSLCFGISGQGADSDGGMAGVDSSGNIVVVRLLDPDYILHDAFNLFECIMTSLAPAYDAMPVGDEMAAALLEEAKTERDESPMELMTSSIVSKIRFVARDEELFGHVLYMPVPPQLYFAKWIRLMFGRELAGGMKSVMTLWGAFFDLAAARASSHEELSINTALLDVLKTAAASMILLIRNLLLAPTMAPDGTMTGEPDPNLGIGYLMNYPPMDSANVLLLVETISNLLTRETKISNQYLVSKERKLSKQYLPSKNYKISSITEHPLDSSYHSHHSSPRSGPLENVYGDGQRNEFIQKIQDEVPLVYRTGGGSQAQPRKQEVDETLVRDPTLGNSLGHDVADSLGNFAEGLFDFGSKTVDLGSSAIANIQKKYEVRRQAADHPLQNNGIPLNIGNSNNDERSDDYVIKYRPRSSSQQAIDNTELPIAKLDLLDQMFDAEDAGGAADDDSTEGMDSIASKLSASKSIGDSIQKTPTELASMLDKSVGILMAHFNERLSFAANAASAPEDDIGNSLHSGHSMLPPEIWNAMADIDLVKKELLTQAALTSMDLARSSTSLRSSGNSASMRRRKNSSEDYSCSSLKSSLRSSGNSGSQRRGKRRGPSSSEPRHVQIPEPRGSWNV